MRTTNLDDLLMQDVVDSREIIERMAALDADDTDDAGELVRLREFVAEAEPNAVDWQYGATLIRDSFFEDYARELAEDIGAIKDEGWPTTYIDWPAAAEALQMDYSSFEFEGVTYWTHS